jgi:Fe2+ or Zn2+ uptake regulation protein
MPHGVETLFREELCRAGLPGHGVLLGLLTLVRASEETHLRLAEVARMAAEAGLAVSPAELARHLKTLADHGFLGRLPTIAAELVFDTVPEPHSHLLYEEPAQIVDLHVSAETLLAIVRNALAARPDEVEVLVRFRRDPAAAGREADRLRSARAIAKGPKRSNRKTRKPKAARSKGAAATIRFLPWTPTADEPRFEGVRVLLVGESNCEEAGLHDADASSDWTRNVVLEWGVHPPTRKMFFANIYAMLTGQPWFLGASDLERFWNSVFFYNYVQTLVPEGSRRRPTRPMWEAAQRGFRDVIERIRPEAVVVLGEDLWQHLPEQDESLDRLTDGLGPICGYTLQDGSVVPAAHTHHPSSPGFRPITWHPKVQGFLQWVASR